MRLQGKTRGGAQFFEEGNEGRLYLDRWNHLTACRHGTARKVHGLRVDGTEVLCMKSTRRHIGICRQGKVYVHFREEEGEP